MNLFHCDIKVNLSMLMRVMGWLLFIEAGFMCAPAAVCLLYCEGDWEAFAWAIGITLAAASALTFLLHPERTQMGKREGFLLTAMVWVVFSLFGMLPFILSGNCIGVSDAFFEAMSAFTTTGVTTIPSVERLSHGLLLWRSLMQWVGGLGIILFTLAVIPMLNKSGGMQMFNAEVTGITHEKIRPRVSQTAKGLWMVYILLTTVLCALLCAGPMSVFDSVCHAFSIMSTGGISTRDAAMSAWESPYIKVVATLFMFIGGVNFALIFRAGTGDVRGAWSNQILRVYVGIIVAFTVVISGIVAVNGLADGWVGLLLDPLFQVVSMITSTGYTLPAMSHWPPVVLLLIMLLMLCGGCAGSTSGGAKIDRFIVLAQHCRNEVERCLRPNSVLSVRTNGRVVPRDLVAKAVAFLCLFVIIIVLSTILLTAMGVSVNHSFFSTFSAITNSGISVSDFGISSSFDALPDAAKWLLSLVMLTGRLELFTVLLLFTSDFWSNT